METLATRNFWKKLGQIRNDRFYSVAKTSFQFAQTQAIEEVINEMISDACWPWFTFENPLIGPVPLPTFIWDTKHCEKHRHITNYCMDFVLDSVPVITSTKCPFCEGKAYIVPAFDPT